MDDAELFAAVAEGLREAHSRVARLAADDPRKASATRQILALNETAKRDLGRAHQRLQGFLAELEPPRQGP